MNRYTIFGADADSSAPWRAPGLETAHTTERWQDKSAHIAPRLGSCFCSIFWRLVHIVHIRGNVCGNIKSLYLPALFNVAEYRHGQ